MRRTPSTASLVAVIMVSRRILGVAAASAVAFSVPSIANAEPVLREVFGPSAFTAPGVFPTSLYRHYYNSPTATSAQPQPVISDPVTVSLRYLHASSSLMGCGVKHEVYPFGLTNPDTIPKVSPPGSRNITVCLTDPVERYQGPAHPPTQGVVWEDP